MQRSFFKDQVYEHLKRAIVKGELSADKIYSEQIIANELGVSRTPVREAVLRLQHENLVDILSNRGFSLRPLSLVELHQIIEARIAIESYSLRYLLENIDTPEGAAVLERMESCAAHKIAATSDEEERYDFMKADMEFHEQSVRFTENIYFLGLIGTMRARIEQALVSALKSTGRHGSIWGEHEEILDGLRRRDMSKTIAALENHLIATENILHQLTTDSSASKNG